MSLDGASYYLRMDHSLYGDLVFGRVLVINGKRSLCSGIIEIRGKKRSSYCVLLAHDGKLTSVPLSKAISVKHEAQPTFCSSDESKILMEMLRVKEMKG